MSILNYRYLGFEYNYEIDVDIKKITDEFKNHIVKEHEIDYSKEKVMQSFLGKKL